MKLTREEIVEEIQKVVNQYQEDTNYAGLTDQLDKYVEDVTDVPLELIGELVDTIGISMSQEIITDFICEELEIDEKDVEFWLRQNMHPIFSKLIAAVGMQVGTHSFIVGNISGKTLRDLKEKREEHAGN